MAISFLTEDTAFRFTGRRKTAGWLRRVAAEEGCTVGSVSVVFCSDAYLLQVNRNYLQHDYYTDIITFDYGEPDRRIISGDLLISVDTVSSNARQFGVSFDDELDRVMVHGVLHLIGYGDKTDPEARTMRTKEDYYLAKRE